MVSSLSCTIRRQCCSNRRMNKLLLAAAVGMPARINSQAYRKQLYSTNLEEQGFATGFGSRAAQAVQDGKADGTERAGHIQQERGCHDE